MPDIVSKATRSRMMSGIKGRDTKPERIIRSELQKRGFRFRKPPRQRSKQLPGNPDIKLTKYRSVIFVHGCFWHAHNCHLFKWPKTRIDFWQDKLLGNVERDRRAKERLMVDGWRVLTIWECAIKGSKKLPLESVMSLTEQWLNSCEIDKEIRGS